MSSVTLDRVAKKFGDTVVVADVSIEIADGELIALLGPSGSGKTTLLRMIAGFETVDAGRILLDGDDVTARSPLERRCGMVFQHYALFPHLTVGENVGYGLEAERLSRTDRAARVAEALAMVDLKDYELRAVTALSGGQQQRVALARALAPRPRVLLLDEPLSNLDPSLRERTRRELRELIDRTGITTVLVTHEQEEAFDLADRVALLHLGHLEQLDTPENLYARPATPFVASFVGRISRLTGEVINDRDGKVRVMAGGIEWSAAATDIASKHAIVLLRPDALQFAADGPVSGTVVHRRFAGANAFYLVRLSDGSEIEVAGPSDAATVGTTARFAVTGDGIHLWSADTA